eukprot:1142901-Pelagomonas_calceolata.AAC.3
MLFKDLFLQRSDDHDRRGFGDPSWPGTEGAYHLNSQCKLQVSFHCNLIPDAKLGIPKFHKRGNPCKQRCQPYTG